MRARATALHLVATAAALTAMHVLAQQPAPTEELFLDVAEQIEAIESSQGLTAAELIRPLRVNYGFSSFNEAPLLRQLVQVTEVIGDAATAWNLEQELIALLRRTSGPGAAQMLREVADKRVDILERYSAGELPPQIVLGCYCAEPDNLESGRRPRVANGVFEDPSRVVVRPLPERLTRSGTAGPPLAPLSRAAAARWRHTLWRRHGSAARWCRRGFRRSRATARARCPCRAASS